MNFQDNKLEISVLIGVTLGICTMMRMLSTTDDPKPNDSFEISYEMPRPKDAVIGDFALNGRDIDRQYVNPFAAKSPNPAKDAKKPVAPPTVPKPVAATRPANSTPHGTLLKRASAGVNVVKKDEPGKTASPGSGAQTAAVADAAKKENPAPAGTSVDRRSSAQWRALLLAEPTKANMDKFIAAFEKHEVDAATFYSVNEELLKSHKKDESGLALYAFNKVGTAQAFETVAADMTSLQSNAIYPYATQFLYSYGSPARAAALKQVLQSGNSTEAYYAANVVLASLQGKIPNGGGTTGGSPRGSSITGSAQAYASFMPIFQGWAAGGNSTLQGLANQILPLLQTGHV